MIKYFSLMFVLVLVAARAGPNPNPGERTTDIGWESGNYQIAFETAKPHADRGEPWAQLRVGIFYYNGWGVEKDHQKALEWYEKAARQKSSGGWAEGKMVGAVGKSGYFNQNGDAIIASFNLSQMYYAGDAIEKDLRKALDHVEGVISDSKGFPVFFCCNFSKPRFFTQEQFQTLKSNIESELSNLTTQK